MLQFTFDSCGGNDCWMHCNFMIYAFLVASASSCYKRRNRKDKKNVWEKLRLLWVNCSVMPILHDKSAYWLLIPDHKKCSIRTIPFVYDIFSNPTFLRTWDYHKSYHLSFILIIYFWWKPFDAAKPSRQIALANDVFRSSIHDKSMWWWWWCKRNGSIMFFSLPLLHFSVFFFAHAIAH